MNFFAMLLLAGAPAASQEPANKPPPPPVEKPGTQTPPAAPPPPGPIGANDAAVGGPILDVDGEVAVAGRLPRSTKPEEAAAFKRVLDAGLVPGSERTKVTAFDLLVDLRYKASARETNDLGAARFRYMSPRYLRRDAGPGREHLRGDAGDFVIDRSSGAAPVVTDVSIVRNGAEDRRQIDESVAVARNFVGLTDPATLRILVLRLLEAPPAAVPERLRERAAKLAWIEFESPDFFVPVKDSISRSARVAIGHSRASGLPEFALVDDAQSPRSVNATTVCIEMTAYEPTNGFLVPRAIKVYRPDPLQPKPAYMHDPGIDMVVKSIHLRPAFTPADFLPPR